MQRFTDQSNSRKLQFLWLSWLICLRTFSSDSKRRAERSIIHINLCVAILAGIGLFIGGLKLTKIRVRECALSIQARGRRGRGRGRGRGRRRGRGRGGGGGRGRGTLTKSIPSKRNTNLEEPSYLAKFPANHQDSPCCMILSAVPILFSFFSFFIYISFHEWNSHWSREERPRAFVNIVQKRVYHVSTCVVFVAYFFPLQRLSSIGGYK